MGIGPAYITVDQSNRRQQPAVRRHLAKDFSLFTAGLMAWVVLVSIAYDSIAGTLSIGKCVVLVGVVGVIAMIVSQITGKLLTKPLCALQAALDTIGGNQLHRLPYFDRGDEIAALGRSFNEMIDRLIEQRQEIDRNQQLLEQRIQERTVELEKAIQEVMAASKAKSEFLANMSHELRTPMNGFLGMIELVLDSPLSGEQREQLDTAQRSALTLLQLLNDILDLSKIESGRMLLEEVPFNLRLLVRDCVKAHSAKATLKGVHFRVQLGDEVPEQCIGDPLRVRQILHNLLSNAVKFTEQGEIRLTLDAVSPPSAPTVELRISVADTGTGIPADKLPQIFEKFTQADGSITRRYGGTGLGLAITRKLVELYGGRLEVRSEVGVGSEFSMALKLQSVERAAPVESPAALQAIPDADHQRARILIVEDNLVNQKVLQGLLRKRGYVAAIAADGQEALDALDAASFDLLLMDIQMPVLDGIEATRRIRAMARWRDLPIIAMTAHAMSSDRDRCLAAGMDDYLTKPINSRELFRTLDQYLGGTAKAPGTAAVAIPAVAETGGPDSSSFVRNMVRHFLILAPERMQRMQSAARLNEASVIAAEARQVESAAKSIDANLVADRARRLEQAAQSRDTAAIRHSLLLLESEIARLSRVNAPPLARTAS